jgi:hypothetical protein
VKGHDTWQKGGSQVVEDGIQGISGGGRTRARLSEAAQAAGKFDANQDALGRP